MPCGTCSRCPSGLGCHQYQFMDNEVLVKLRAKKEVLAQDDKAQCLTVVCEQVYGCNWRKYYSACNLRVLSFGTKSYVFTIPPTIDKTRYEAYLKGIVTIMSTRGIMCALYCARLSNKSVYRSSRHCTLFANSPTTMMPGADMKFPCGPNCTYKGKVVECWVGDSEHDSITSILLTNMLQKIDSYKVFDEDRANGVHPILLIDGHGSSFEVPLLQYTLSEIHNWYACIGTPWGQVFDR
jgi:hypothetical protein